MKLPEKARFATICIHAGQEPDASTGALITPIYQTSTFVHESFGKHKGYEYARTENPTRAALEANLAAIEGGTGACAFASGMAAISAIMTALAPALSAGTPILGLEPSCVAVFRDELTNLFPDDRRAQALKRQTQLVTEFLSNETHLPWPSISGRAIVHMHCHHKAVLDSAADPATLRRIGLETHVLDSGCCGMAGSFGFERDHYDVSLAIGERVLLPAVRAAHHDDFIVADGFSCREQIVQTTGRQAVHPIELVARAMRLNGWGNSQTGFER